MQLKDGDEHFKGYDAVFFIAGITSVGTPKDVYVRISQEIPLHFADIMPDKERMTYIYLMKQNDKRTKINIKAK